jgi:hypothetical protein
MFQDKPCICVPITSNANKHQSEVAIVGLHLSFDNGEERYINFTHPDEIDTDISLQEIKLHPKSLVFNKKVLVDNDFNDGFDINSYLHYYGHPHISSQEFYPKGMEYLVNKFYKIEDLGHVIPLVNQLEWTRGIAKYVLRLKPFEFKKEKCVNYCNDFIEVFHEIEKNNITICGIPQPADQVMLGVDLISQP